MTDPSPNEAAPAASTAGAATGGTPEPNDSDRWLTPGVAGVGAASFFSDAGHEMATSVLPTFLGSTLGAGAGALGAIEGVSDALIGVAKLAGGPLSNDPARRGKLASGGYLLTALATAAIGFTTAVWQVAPLRALAWMSRGIRSPARDTLLISLVPRRAYGRASGLERAGDNAGAIVGPLMAAALVGVVGVRDVFFLAFIPSIFAVVGISAAAREASHRLSTPVGRRTFTFNIRELRQQGLLRAFVPVSLFELGNVATSLLILRATGLLHTGSRSLTTATTIAILLYAAHNAAATVSALVGGSFVDRTSPRRVFAVGAAVYVAGYLLFAWEQHSIGVLLAGFLLAGVGIGCAETAESTTVAVMLPDALRGNGFGVLGLVQSIGDLGASLVVGLLWATVGPVVAFSYAAAWMGASVVAVLTQARRRRTVS